MNKQSKRVGPKMQQAVDIVANNPGCCIRYVARRLHVAARSGMNNGLGYDPVHRAIKAGLISYAIVGGRYHLRANVAPCPPIA